MIVLDIFIPITMQMGHAIFDKDVIFHDRGRS